MIENKTAKQPSKKVKILVIVLSIIIGFIIIITVVLRLPNSINSNYVGINVPSAIEYVPCPSWQVVVSYSTPINNPDVLSSFECGDRPKDCEFPMYYPYGDTTDQMYELACSNIQESQLY